MKKTYLIQGVLLLFLAFQFNSCANEPLEGEFLEDEGPIGAEEGQFKANIAGQQFIAEFAIGNLSDSNKLVISGSKSNGQSISLSVADPAVGEFSLDWDGAGPNLGTFLDGNPDSLPYVSGAENGGSGQMKITSMDTVSKTLTGSFEFKGVRIKRDSAGEPVLDGDGNPVIESIEITNGAFDSIIYIGGSGGF